MDFVIPGQSSRGPWQGGGAREDWSQMLPDLREGTFQAPQSFGWSSQSRKLHPGKQGADSTPTLAASWSLGAWHVLKASRSHLVLTVQFSQESLGC